MTAQHVFDGEASHFVACCRAEEMLDSLPDGCVSLMTLDFPYFRVKGPEVAWDNAWPTAAAFIEWMGGVLAKCRRVLAPNGSIYVFAAPQVREGLTMATRVEVEVARHFSVLQRITWQKPEGSTKAEMFDKDTCRAFFPASEAIVFAEQQGASFECGALFDSLRAYLDGERTRAGVGKDECNEACGFSRSMGGMAARHYFSRSQWALPTPEHYARLRSYFNRNGGDFLSRSHEDLLAEFENLRRSFSVSPDVPYTDVWTYATVNAYPGKHPCEKPFLMAEHIIAASSRPGDVVADFFCGSGTFLAAAVHGGRRAIGCDMDPHWAEQAQRRCDAVKATGRIVRTAPKPKDDRQIDLFGRRA